MIIIAKKKKINKKVKYNKNKNIKYEYKLL